MSEPKTREGALAALCAETPVEPGHANLLKGLSNLYPDLTFRRTLMRSGWHRVGGVINKDLEPVADNIRNWAEAECGHDMFALYERYGAEELLTTRLDGRSHYFIAPTGDRSPDFIQIEVEELCEVVDRPLFVGDQIPDDMEELIDPPGGFEARLEPVRLAPPRYVLRAVTDIDEMVADHVTSEGSDLRYIRFLEEWDSSSAGTKSRFCNQFVLRLLPFRDRFGERKIEAIPLLVGEMPPVTASDLELSGTRLADLLLAFDREAGFPMAWYFTMLIRKKEMIKLAQAVYTDAQRNYRYLPDRDLAILEAWFRKPYSF